MQKTFPAIPNALTSLLWRGLFVASCLPLVVFAYLGTFTRYLADDYSTAGALSKYGFWPAQAFWYQSWSGKFTYTFLVSASELAGVPIVRFLPALCLALWGACLFWSLRLIFRALSIQARGVWLGIMVTIILFGTIKSFRDYQQVIFWQTGIAAYMSSVIFSTLLAGGFTRRVWLMEERPLAGWEYAAWFLAVFVSGGCSETWAIIQVAMCGLGCGYYLLARQAPGRKIALLILLTGLLAACAALVVIAKAPGNMNRDTVMAELSFGLLSSSVLSAFKDVPLFLAGWLRDNTTLALMLLLGGFTPGFCLELPAEGGPKRVGLGAGLLVGAYILMWAGFVPQFAVMGVRPPDRAIFTPMFIFLWMSVLLAFLAGLALRSRAPARLLRMAGLALQTGLVLLMVWVPVRASFSYVKMAPALQAYAQLWDQRDGYLREQRLQGARDVSVPSLRRSPVLHDIQSSFWLEGEMQEAPDFWINQAAADYYGLRSIRGTRKK